MARVGPRRAPRAAGRCRCRRRALPRQPPGVMVEEGSGEPPPGGGAIVTPRGRAPAHKDILGRAARVSGRRCEAARHVPGRSREEHHHSLLTVLEQCRRTRSLGAARPPARPGGGKATDGTRLVCIPPASRSPGSISVVVVVGDVGLAQLAELTLSWVAVERCRGGTEVSARGARAGAPQV